MRPQMNWEDVVDVHHPPYLPEDEQSYIVTQGGEEGEEAGAGRGG